MSASGSERTTAREVSAGFFGLLGTRLELGRDFQAEDDHEGAGPVAILSYGLWQRRFGGTGDVLGKVVRLNERNYTVVGVTARDFWFFSNQTCLYPSAELARCG